MFNLNIIYKCLTLKRNIVQFVSSEYFAKTNIEKMEIFQKPILRNGKFSKNNIEKLKIFQKQY